MAADNGQSAAPGTAGEPVGGARVTRPLTGDEYIESIRDGREIWAYGEKVDDVTKHPAFRNTVRMTARLYDALHDPEHHDTLTAPTDTGSDGFTHKFYRVPRSVQDLVGDRDAIAEWARLTYGWMGRSPDYKASFLVTLGANPEYYGDFADNARQWYATAQEQVLFWNHAVINPPVDRHRPADEVDDVFVHVEKECDDGLVVSGAKVVATGSALTHFNFVAHYGLPVKKKEFALVATLPLGAPGVKLVCRQSYELAASRTGSPFDYPLSAGSTRTTPSSFWTRSRSPGRTSSSTGTPRGPARSCRRPVSPTGSPSTA